MEGILLIDKPAGITSFGIVPRLRRLTGIQKIGHSGTLDSFATGLMLFLVGRNYTKKCPEFTGYSKSYDAVLHLGVQTDTSDPLGSPIATSSFIPEEAMVFEMAPLMEGSHEQVPPLYSAKKIKGKRASDWAREGVNPLLKACNVEVFKFNITYYSYPEIHFSCHVSKGTYVRVLAEELAKRLGCAGHLTSLRRTRVDSYSIEKALKYDDLSLEAIEGHLLL